MDGRTDGLTFPIGEGVGRAQLHPAVSERRQQIGPGAQGAEPLCGSERAQVSDRKQEVARK